VPVENLIGGIPGLGLKQATKVFGYTRVMVAAMALGGGEAALDIAIAYAKERIQFKTPLSEKQGYTHKLIVPHVIRLAAAEAYIEEVAERLDSGEKELEVEGSIAKLFATESANKAADDAMQALGGYGYIAEYEVEKIKRDVRITCIYEGTSEIQQNIISTFRWKKTRKSKGQFYRSISDEMDKLHAEFGDLGCGTYGLAARALNQTVTLVNDHRLTRQQFIMFALADMATHVEVGAGLARRAFECSRGGDSGAEKIKLISRLFGNEVAQVVSQNILKIVLGCGEFDQKTTADFLAKVGYTHLTTSFQNIIKDMDELADIVFER
jgi:alkylation response protein AidB-like acyl-CoA dehydrogenase